MKTKNTLLIKLGSLPIATVIRCWMRTLRFRIAYYDHTVDPASPQCRGQKIYLLWHEYLLLPLCVRGSVNAAILLSRHRDADILVRFAHHLGLDVVRGSTTRGGLSAIRQLLQKSQRMHLGITPDGPLGPRRQMAPGPIYLASKLGLPLVVTGFGFDRPWRVGSWDRFALPRPFSRARAVVSREIHVPPDLDQEGREYFRARTERLLNRLTAEAEAWATSGTRELGPENLAVSTGDGRTGRVDRGAAVAGPQRRRTSRSSVRGGETRLP